MRDMHGKIKVILSVILLTAVMMLAAACSGTESEALGGLEDILNALKSCDSEKIDEYYSFDQVTAYVDKADGERFRDAVISTLSKMDYKIDSTERVSDSAVNVTVELTTVDFSKIVESYIDKVMNKVNSSDYQKKVPGMTEEEYTKEMTELMNNCISENMDTKTTKTLTVTMIKGASGKWTVGGNTDEFLGALFADLSDAVDYLV